MIHPSDGGQAGLFEETEETQSKKKAGSGRASSRLRPADLGLVAPSQIVKNYVLDTNVLLHDPGCLGRFKENHICVPVDVLAELDRFKGEQSERGANARQVHRRLVETFSAAESVTAGVPTEGGGTLRMVVFDSATSRKGSEEMTRFHRIFPDRERVDHRILACVLLLKQHNKAPVVLVTKDLNMHLKARSVGIESQDYLNDKVDPAEVANYEIRKVEVDCQEMQRFASSGSLELAYERRVDVVLNQYVLLLAGEKQTMPARLGPNGCFVRLQIPEALRIPDGNSLKPLNLGQKCLLDALLNPEIALLTCYGHAGTGKTLVAVAAGLHEVCNRSFNGLTISRPVVAMGDQLGFLPGTLDEKMRPWLQPIHDALDLLTRPPATSGPRRKHAKKEGPVDAGRKPYEALMDQGVIEIEALCYIRGRSIPNRFFVLDEAQQLTPQEAKTVVTRMSRGSKLVMVGDPAQIDNPYVDSRSNGLVYARNRLKGQPFAAHVTLNKGERSALAEAGAQLL